MQLLFFVAFPLLHAALIRIENTLDSPVDVFISNYNGGSDEWYRIEARSFDFWNRREGYEMIVARDQKGQRCGMYVRVLENYTPVHAYPSDVLQVSIDQGWTGKLFVRQISYRSRKMGVSCLSNTGHGFRITNMWDKPIWVFVSKYNRHDGCDNWYKIEPGHTETWDRPKYKFESVVFSTGPYTAGEVRDGYYLEAPREIEFYGQ